MRPRFAMVTVAVAALVLLAGCSGSASPPSQADGDYVRDMAISAATTMDLADQARTRSNDPKVQSLADDVFTTMAPVADGLTELGPALAADGAKGFAHTESEDHTNQSALRSENLRKASAKQFDGTFLRLLRAEAADGLKIAQQAQGAVTDARTKESADSAVRTWTTLTDRLDAST